MQTVFEAAGGDEGLVALAAAWHHRVMADEIVSHAFSHGFHPQHTERLAAYWAEALGGPSTYSATYGDETSVVRMHSGNGPHEEMDQRAIACFDQALDDVGLDDVGLTDVGLTDVGLTDVGLTDVGLRGNATLRQVLHDYFAWATTTTMAAYHGAVDDVPDDLQIPHWSWDGLQK
jgi:hemoglobin